MLCVDMELFFVLVGLFGLCASLEISFLSEIFWTEKVRGVSDPVQCNNRLMLKEETLSNNNDFIFSSLFLSCLVYFVYLVPACKWATN